MERTMSQDEHHNGGLHEDDLEAAERLHAAYERIRGEIARVIVGQDEVLELMLVALFARGHVILEGVPGLAKTLMVSSTARCLGLKFNRIQFMPDLMPADITGTEIIQEDRRTGSRSFRFLPGPVFANVLLADEVNRTPPKTQAALLEAMQERCVTVGGVRHEIDPPFFVLATQNPIEQEGTYPLPEAQQDRFMFKLFVDYPSYDEEYEIAERTTGAENPAIGEVLQRDEILRLQELVRRVPAAPSVIRYTLDLVRLTRPYGGERAGMPIDLSTGGLETRRPELKRDAAPSLDLVNRLVLFGAGPRAVQFMLLGAKARAILKGRAHVATEDVRAMAHPVLRHRIITSYAAEAEGYNADRIIDHILEAHPNVTHGAPVDAGVEQIFES
ncbi:MAG: MoxR family ATPase [Planctomycetota bacterium]|nr:MAG: MoxR family ATPase [Planctomycetota bacterium]